MYYLVIHYKCPKNDWWSFYLNLMILPTRIDGYFKPGKEINCIL
jgi:hypothetical protein